MYYVYILESKSDRGFYIGCTRDLRKRVAEHKSGKAVSTRNRLPLDLIYYEACLDQSDAFRREKYLKKFGLNFVRIRDEELFGNPNKAFTKIEDAAKKLKESKTIF